MFKSNFLVSRAFFLVNADFIIVILDLILRVHLDSFVTMLPKLLEFSTNSSYFLSIIIYMGHGCLELLITAVFLHPFPFHNIIHYELVYSYNKTNEVQ